MPPSDQEGDVFQSWGDEKFGESKEASFSKFQSSSLEEADDPNYEFSEMETISEYSPGPSSNVSTGECLSLVLDYFGEGDTIDYPLNPAFNRQKQPKKTNTKICK